MPDTSLDDLTAKVIQFRDERDWKQFHNPKDIAVSLLLEATEFLELYQWKNDEAATAVEKNRIEEELADVLYWVLLAGHDLKVDLPKALAQKLEANAAKYPVKTSRGKATKYTGR